MMLRRYVEISGMKHRAALTISLALAAILAFSNSSLAGSQFKSPTGNIICSFADHMDGQFGARCDIIESNINFDKPLRPAPGDCDADWGNIFFAPSEGEAGLICAGDLAANPDEASVLGYEQVINEGGVTCRSDKAGMTCINRQGHGFIVSRNRQELF
jgi:hypothetical protein